MQTAVRTTSAVSTVTPSIPAVADQNQVIVTLRGVTVATVRTHSYSPSWIGVIHVYSFVLSFPAVYCREDTELS